MLTESEIQKLTVATIKAGGIILDYFNNKNYEIKYKKPYDPVTSADMESNEIITHAIEKTFPGDLIVSEETYIPGLKDEIDRKRSNAGRIWIIDPLDGTKDFIKGLPNFAVSIGFVNNNEARYGIIYNPVHGFLLQGGPDYGLSLNGKKLETVMNNPEKLENMNICISKSEAKQNLFHDLLKVVPDKNIRYIGSVAYKMSLLAAGEIDLVLSKRHKSDWDIAGALAILSARDCLKLDKNFQPICLNKKNITTDGLVIGCPRAIDLYKSFINRF
jgi:myo-inositol-1(or 4)-monophosphatase